MDSLTQIVLGAAVAEYFVGRKLGNRALLYGGILGTIPDLDVFVGMFYDIVTSNEIHRGFSHSIVFFLLLTPLLGMAIMYLERRRQLKINETFQAVFWCLFTHAILDAFTNWGTQLFWPIEHRVAIQSIFVIDPLYTLPFIFCLIMVMRYKRDDARRRKWNIRGIAISSCYLALTVVLQAVAKHQFVKSLNAQNIAYSDVSVRPAPLTAILWNANVATPDGYYLGEYSFFDSKPIGFDFYKKDSHLLGNMADEKVVSRLIKTSEGWWNVTHEGDKLYFNDLRFGIMNDDVSKPEFVFRYQLVWQNGRAVGLEAESPSRKNPKKLLARLWTRIKGN